MENKKYEDFINKEKYDDKLAVANKITLFNN